MHNQRVDANILKIIAIVTMFIDHIGAVVLRYYTSFENNGTELFAGADMMYSISRAIGRSAFPIFCFLLVEGFFHTKSIKKYAGRLLVFALISEVPFDLAIRFHGTLFYWQRQSVFWTLLIGFLMMVLVDFIVRPSDWGGPPAYLARVSLDKFLSVWKEVPLFVRIIVALPIVWVAMQTAQYVLHSDYGADGIAVILIFCAFRQVRPVACALGYVYFFGVIKSPAAFPAFLLILCYSGNKGLYLNKYLFYVFYPLHLLLLYGLRVLLFGG